MEKELVFHPMVGQFETEVYQIPVNVSTETQMMRCGVLPPILEQELAAAGIEGILGTELYDYYVASFDRGTLRITLQRNRE